MSANNRQRRAAKQRRRAADRRRRESDRQSVGPRPLGPRPLGPDAFDVDREEMRRQAGQRLRFVLARIAANPESAGHLATEFVTAGTPVERELARDAVRTALSDLAGHVTENGWTPADLGALTRRRRLTAGHTGLLVTLLAAETRRHPHERTAPAWRDELADLGAPQEFELAAVTGMRLALELADLLASLPRIAQVLPPPGAATIGSATRSGGNRNHLSRVRALLAKAEATAYPEEAEALSAKAQELITRYALEHLIDAPEPDESDDGVRARRIWIDPPYVLPKAMLINAAAEANRCQTIVSQRLGFTTIMGAEQDIAVVELLATSLLVQADRAMLAHGRRSTQWGTSRTAAFRRSFLASYAQRIGERLRAASEDALADTGRAHELLPVLRGHAERVQALQDKLFPEITRRAPSVSDAQGWALGRAAADLAQLDFRRAVTE